MPPEPPSRGVPIWFMEASRSTAQIGLRAPVIMLVLAATAVPIELRPISQATFHLGLDAPPHILANVAGYLPVGLVLAELGAFRAIAAAAAISLFAETSQLAMVYREPSISDFLANVLGAMLGAGTAKHWRISALAFRTNRWTSFAAITFASLILVWAWATSGGFVNSDGWASEGILEARWNFDEDQGRVARESSGHNLNAKFKKDPVYVEGVLGRAAVFNGREQFVDAGRTTALRLVGNMSITAWIKSASFPLDDAAIVSQSDHDLGYQLDTTVDRGPRTIGFKLTNACGERMIRYGRTPLMLDTWYHVAGVYNAEAKTLDVYLNGQPDNGFLLGFVTGTQHPSRAAVYMGRRSDSENFGFDGLIDDVRIYSLALTKTEIAAAMRGAVVERAAKQGVSGHRRTRRPIDVRTPCAVFAEPYDIEIPLAATAVGLLAAVACIGLWPTASSALYITVSVVAGSALLAGVGLDLPSVDFVTMPLASAAGGVSVIFSMRRS